MMNEEKKRFKLDEEQKTRLFSLGLNSEISLESLSAERSRKEVLLDLLAETLPADPRLIQSLPEGLQTLAPDLQSVTGEPIGVLLRNSKTSVTVFEAIKDYAKKLEKSIHTKAEREAVLSIYHAAIAGGLVFHQKKITRYDFSKLAHAFASLSRQDWIPHDLVRLFAEAAAICNREKI